MVFLECSTFFALLVSGTNAGAESKLRKHTIVIDCQTFTWFIAAYDVQDKFQVGGPM